MRLSPYIEGVRPLKLTLKIQTVTQEDLDRTYQLNEWKGIENSSIG